MRALAASVVVLVLAGFAGAADEKIDAKKLIGKWEPAKAEKDGPKMVLEIGEKDKFTLHVTVNGKTEKIDGTYKLDGNKLEVEMSFGGKTEKETITITKLTDTELVAKDSKGKEDTMNRVKEKK
ncbi:TIGR03066 family protein [Gemmata sp. G18]|uniref:TIGR03066 family protein n=1 Tax=Gemmata palustris TaxID=2822762 RepID=A0ABS5BNF1_9BACT|nr:TIGR03066 family protein [Gemmata palustris]MBP3955259.1 TIGR03066 family protein [Gemmata palustris]